MDCRYAVEIYLKGGGSISGYIYEPVLNSVGDKFENDENEPRVVSVRLYDSLDGKSFKDAFIVFTEIIAIVYRMDDRTP